MLLAMQVPSVTEGETEAQEAGVALPSSAELFCGGTWNSHPALLRGWVFPCLPRTPLPISAHRIQTMISVSCCSLPLPFFS